MIIHILPFESNILAPFSYTYIKKYFSICIEYDYFYDILIYTAIKVLDRDSISTIKKCLYNTCIVHVADFFLFLFTCTYLCKKIFLIEFAQSWSLGTCDNRSSHTCKCRCVSYSSMIWYSYGSHSISFDVGLYFQIEPGLVTFCQIPVLSQSLVY